MYTNDASNALSAMLARKFRKKTNWVAERIFFPFKTGEKNNSEVIINKIITEKC